MVNKFLFEGTVANGLKDTNICLIPKTTKPMKWLSLDPLACATSATR